jgi:hypothetical protein
MITVNVIQAIIALMAGLGIVLLARKLASIPFRVRQVPVDPNSRRFRAMQVFWLCCGALWMISGLFLLIDPGLAIQFHPPASMPK